MNQLLFGAKNVIDKLIKCIINSEISKTYFKTYILGYFEVKKLNPDVYIVSYPKCGRTWLRVLFQKYFELKGASLKRYNSNFIMQFPNGKTVKFEHDQGNWVPAPKKIEDLVFNSSKYENSKIIFLSRDPRDVLVSSWHHLTSREKIYTKDISAFIRDELVGVDKVVTFMNMWMENADALNSFLLITYEQMHSDTYAAAKSMLEFAEVEVDGDVLHQAVQATSFNKMKKIESKGSLDGPWMKAGSPKKASSMKVRKGKVGSYKEELTELDIEYLNKIIHDKLSKKLPYH